MRIFKILVGAVLFVACVFVATANMHEVRLAFPDVPIRGWPHVGDVYAPLFVVILSALLLGVLLTGLATLLEQVRLRTVARRARKERDRAAAALTPAERARDAAIAERDVVAAERDALRGDLESTRAELERVKDEGEALHAEVERLRRATEAHAPASTPGPGASAARPVVEEEEAS